MRAAGQTADTLPGEQEEKQALEHQVAAAAQAAARACCTPIVLPTDEALRGGCQTAADGGEGASEAMEEMDSDALATLAVTAFMALASGEPGAAGAAAAAETPGSSQQATVRNSFYLPVRRQGQVVHPFTTWV
jgi:hypothetical protein